MATTQLFRSKDSLAHDSNPQSPSLSFTLGLFLFICSKETFWNPSCLFLGGVVEGTGSFVIFTSDNCAVYLSSRNATNIDKH